MTFFVRLEIVVIPATKCKYFETLNALISLRYKF